MIILKNKAILIALILTLAGMGLIGINTVQAQNTNPNPFSTLVQKIADKFGLKKEDVQAVFDQDRADRQIEMEKKYLARLDQLVKDGKITEAQKQLIINKHKERKTIREANKTKMETERKELEDWAKQNNINPQYLFGFGRGHFRGMKGGWGKKFDG